MGTYRAIALYPFCVSPSRSLRLIYARVKPIIDPLLPQEQASLLKWEVNYKSGHPADIGHRG